MSIPTRPRLRERYERRRRTVVATAARLFAEQGYRQTSIEDLVHATGLQRGGLYHYIDGKEHLLRLIHDDLMEPLLADAAAILAAPAPPADQLRSLMRVWVEHVASHRDHMVVFNEERRLIESHPDWAEVRAAREAFREAVAGVLRRGLLRGEFASADPEIALLAILGIVNHMPQWLQPGGRLTPAEIADRCSDLVLSGLLPRPV